ncbi:hypothetical protein HGD90_05870 [Rhodobacteraceae bacterium R_SAG7]|jgi:hypothetical protein|uniref:hypothetical protein n=1 Tax=Rhodobacterales TaxID=204455 RepID=UPI0000462F9F|nr:hypothetical protein [Ruegeria sp. TM1040]ABF64855.1 hypothetical protein TM1040_2123 [Ruegeria sp. TM1040]MDF9303423.1 hypothetical protein [Tritonibacter mobilis]NKW78931.1 hypothetical protein [Rhodobacteraceae bacterium R_SAG7]
MPELIKLYIKSALWGLVLAALFVAILLWFNIANLGALVFGSDSGVIAVLALWISNAVVFGGVQFGFKIMAMAERDDTPRGGTWVGPEMQPVPIPAKASKPQRRTLR